MACRGHPGDEQQDLEGGDGESVWNPPLVGEERAAALLVQPGLSVPSIAGLTVEDTVDDTLSTEVMALGNVRLN